MTSPALTPERIDLVARSIGESVDRLRRSIDDLMALLRLEHAIDGGAARADRDRAPLLEALADEYRRDPRAAGWTFAVEATPEAAAALPVVNRAPLAGDAAQPDRQRAGAARDRSAHRPGRARWRKRWLVTSVRDAGPGISAENQGKIFRRFFTQRPPGVPPGTGLGLSIVESVAHAHGARSRSSRSRGRARRSA